MKKITIVLLFILLIGCQSNANEIDQTSFNYEASYEGLHHALGGLSTITRNETGFYQIAYNESDNYLVSYSNDTKKTTLLNNDPSNDCSITNVKNCSGYIGEGLRRNIHYYNHKIYYIEINSDENTGLPIYDLIECDLDGANQKKVYTFPVLAERSGGLSLTFHKGYIYHTLGEQGLKRIDMRNWKEEQFNESLDKAKDCRIFFVRNSTFIAAKSYEENGINYENVLLEISSVDNSVKILLENATIWSMNDEMLTGYDVKGDSLYLYTMTWDDLEKNNFMNGPEIGELYLNDEYIAVTTDGSTSGVYLYNLQGELLDVYHEEDDKKFNWCQGFIGENLLIQAEKGIYFFLPIVDQAFGEAMVIETNKQ